MASKDDKPTSDLSPGDYEQLGRWMQEIVESSYINKWRLMRASFIKGLAQALGATIGLAIVIAILGWILSQLPHLPFVDNIQHTINQSEK